ncbi:MAG TPA: glycosyltransferase N-terminal domain-containing protein [Bacteroidia bacterium]|nr:glycosyltransferase N-terminal domain-containing protein [Bacteroidia bacterium]
MKFMYSFGLFLYRMMIHFAAAAGNQKAGQWLNGRKNWPDQLKVLTQKKEMRYWIHCSSLGEFEQGRPLIEEIRKREPKAEIILTFFSPSGFEIRKNYPLADLVLYLPPDSPKNASQFIETINPDSVFFIKYDYWFYYLSILQQRNIPVYMVSAIFRPTQIFFKWYGGFFKSMLKKVTYFFVQDDASADLLIRAGISRCTITGDTRFDRVYAVSEAAMEIPILGTFSRDNFVLIAGSTWPPDEDLIIETLHEMKLNKIKVILVPHEVNPQSIRNLEARILKSGRDIRCQKYSQAFTETVSSADVLIIDTIGLLSSAYRYSAVAYIGGGFGKGIHNILEAAAFGIPVLFGPNYKKFREASDLIRIAGAVSIRNPKEFSDEVFSLSQDNEKRERAGRIAKEYVLSQTGATSRILDFIGQSQHLKIDS